MAFGISAGTYLMGGIGLLGASMTSSAASKASEQQAQSGRESNALQQAQYEQTRADNAGVRLRGDAAGNRLSYLMGTGEGSAGDPSYGSLSRNFGAGDMSSDPQYAQLQPQIDGALQRSANFQTSPGYAFRTAEGQKAVENSAASRNGSYSGATLKALARFGQDNASAEYGNWQTQSNIDRNFVAGQGQDAFNRFTGNQDRQYNRLAGVAGTGQTATNNVNSAGAAYAANAGNTLQGIGNAQAAGTVGGANAWMSAGQQGINNYQQNNMLDLLRSRQNSGSLYAPSVEDGGYSLGQGSAYGGNRAGM